MKMIGRIFKILIDKQKKPSLHKSLMILHMGQGVEGEKAGLLRWLGLLPPYLPLPFWGQNPNQFNHSRGSVGRPVYIYALA